MDKDVQEILLAEEVVQAKVRELAETISRDYAGRDIVLICILKGAVIFAADLMRHLTIPSTLDFMAISSYGTGTRSSGVVRILKDLDEPLEGRHVLVVEDIIDSGFTLRYLKDLLQSRGPASLRTCVLLDKPSRREVPIHIDYLGFEIPDKFVIGYGLDYAEHYRQLPFIGVLKPEVYENAPSPASPPAGDAVDAPSPASPPAADAAQGGTGRQDLGKAEMP